MRRSTFRAVAFATAFLGFTGCGGGDGEPSGPPAVALVTLTAPASELEIGGTMQLSYRVTDASGTTLSGRAITFESSSAAIASVDQAGVVTGVSEGQATIRATSEGKQGSVTLSVVRVPVADVRIQERTPAVRQGEVLTLSARTFDAIGRELPGREITWSSANPTTATVTNAGVVSGVAAGTVFIRVESETRRDSVQLRVRSLVSPTITGTGGATWTPAGSVTVSGTNFSLVPGENELLVSGVRATVTASTATTITATIPAAAALPCSPTGPVPIVVVVNGDSAYATAPLAMATQRSLAVGDMLSLTSAADLQCNEFSVTGGKYLVTAYNYEASPNDTRSFILLGDAVGAQTTQSAAPSPAVVSPPPPSATIQGDPALRARLDAHYRTHTGLREAERAFLRAHPRPRTAMRNHTRAKARAGVQAAQVPVPPPNVGDMASFRMRQNLDNLSSFDHVRFRVVYAGTHIIMYEDSLAPLARTMDAEYQRIGQEFDQSMYPLLANFGNPIAADAELDNNGRVVALFSKRVNGYRNGSILGFVTVCDYFPATGPSSCPSSNVGEVFYALVPDPNAPTNSLSLDFWRRLVRGTLIHETKHLTSYSERYIRDASELEETWLEEGTAQAASELWARDVVYGSVQRGDARWLDGPRCDYAQESGTCPDPVEGILHHFQFLYRYYDEIEAQSVLGRNSQDGTIYGSAWSLVRWATDVFSTDEGTFLRALTQVQNEYGIENLTSKTGRSWQELMALWSIASLADNYPNGTVNDVRVRLPGWNTRDMFSSMNQFLRFQNGDVAFPRAWPLNVRAVQFGRFTTADRRVFDLPGGGYVPWEISGSQTQPQVLAIRATNGGPPPQRIGLVVLRVE